jgi:hypothetical protein
MGAWGGWGAWVGVGFGLGLAWASGGFRRGGAAGIIALRLDGPILAMTIRTTSISAAAFVAVVLLGLGGCEDDGGAPGWNAGIADGGGAGVDGGGAVRDGGAAVLDTGGVGDAAAGDAADDGSRDATGF